MNCTEKKTM